jgi:hypothetical protein
MALIILEGLDRTGKSTVANYYQSLGYELIHLSAPPKGTTSDQYLQSMVDIVSSAAAKDIVMDRSHYGELVWSTIYGRKPLLNDEDIEIIREIEESVSTKRILMYDPQHEEHWKRCVDNKEPLTKQQFVKAKALFSQMAHNYRFELVTLPSFLKEYPDAGRIAAERSDTSVDNGKNEPTNKETASEGSTPEVGPKIKSRGLTAEQLRLEKANAINEIISKRILKSKGEIYDELENELRTFLNTKLGKLLGTTSQELNFSKEEVSFYKEMYKRAISKGDH